MVITTGGAGNWSDSSGAGAWTGTTKPASGDSVVIAHAIVLDEDPAAGITLISSSTTGGYLTVSGTRTLPSGCGVTYSSTDATNGFVRVVNGTTLTINGTVTNSSTGYCVMTAGTGTLTISNAGNTAVTASAGRGVNSTGTGKLAITGNVIVSTGYGVYIASTYATGDGHTIEGDISISAGTQAVEMNASGGKLTLLGTSSVYKTTTKYLTKCVVQIDAGTVVISGNRSTAAGDTCLIVVVAGTLNISSVTWSVSGKLVIANNGTLTATSAVVNLMTADAQFVLFGTTEISDTAGNLNGPSLPAAGDVDSTAADYGYASALIEPTCVLPAEADVEDGVTYGAAGTEFTGTLAAGGGGGPRVASMNGGLS